jgi:hypothetical protein
MNMTHLYLGAYSCIKINSRCKQAVICDSLIIEMKKCYAIYEWIHNVFSFLFDYKSEDLEDKTKASQESIAKYQNDVGEKLESELIHFYKHVIN